MVLYTLLQLAEVKAVDSMYDAFGKLAVTLGGIKRFRQHDCTCPNHLEYHTDHYAVYTGGYSSNSVPGYLAARSQD